MRQNTRVLVSASDLQSGRVYDHIVIPKGSSMIFTDEACNERDTCHDRLQRSFDSHSFALSLVGPGRGGVMGGFDGGGGFGGGMCGGTWGWVWRWGRVGGLFGGGNRSGVGLKVGDGSGH